MEGEMIIVSIVGGIFTVITIQLINHNWFKRQDHRLKNTKDMKELEYKHKKGMKKLGLTVKTPLSKGGFDLGNLGKILGNLDDETILSLKDALTGEGYDIPTEGGDLASTFLKAIPEDTLKSIAKGFVDKTSAGAKETNIKFEQ